MIIRCKKCGESIDESKKWTVCPHNPLDQAHDSEFCRDHKQFDCHACDEYMVRR
ncbi:MAG TPA: hypothetical protein VE262_23615 [Blastocatellia bacterium]|nr:hypothetical protein [Blastocatellia bacterium]